MKPVVDIISDVITAMKPTISVSSVSYIDDNTLKLAGLTRAVTSCLFAGQKLKCIIGGVAVYGIIASVESTYITVDLPPDDYSPTTPTAVSVVLNYHYGHLIEIRNTFRLWTQKSTVKKEQFPAIVLVQDFPEEVDEDQQVRTCKLRVLILTDSKQTYTAAERYTNTFEPILYPLCDMFLEKLKQSDYVDFEQLKYTRIDRLFWGRTQGDEGTATNIFNDFIDAIELENLNLKILTLCKS